MKSERESSKIEKREIILYKWRLSIGTSLEEAPTLSDWILDMFTNGTILRGNFSFVKQKDETVPILPNPVKQGIFIVKSGITDDYDGKIGVISVKIQRSVYKMLA